MRKRGHEIHPAKFCRIAAGLACGDLDQAFNHKGRFRPAGAAIGVDRRGVGVDRVNLAVNARNIVLTRQQRRVGVSRDERRECRHVGAEIGDRVRAQPDDLAAGVEREFGVGHVIAAMRVGEEGLRALAPSI